MNKQNAVAIGSVTHVANQSGRSELEVLMSIDAIALVDSSQSMTIKDAGKEGQLTRHDAAEQELRKVQAQYPGRVGVVSFSSRAELCMSGVPTRFNGGTRLAPALEIAKDFDASDRTTIVITDGDVEDEQDSLDIAKTLKGKIQTIYIGGEDNSASAKAFLKRLANANRRGGKFADSIRPGMLAEPMTKILQLSAPSGTSGAIAL